jgi:hypothetical protein
VLVIGMSKDCCTTINKAWERAKKMIGDSNTEGNSLSCGSLG